MISFWERVMMSSSPFSFSLSLSLSLSLFSHSPSLSVTFNGIICRNITIPHFSLPPFPSSLSPFSPSLSLQFFNAAFFPGVFEKVVSEIVQLKSYSVGHKLKQTLLKRLFENEIITYKWHSIVKSTVNLFCEVIWLTMCSCK